MEHELATSFIEQKQAKSPAASSSVQSKPAVRGRTHSVLELQRRVGNQAVQSLLNKGEDASGFTQATDEVRRSAERVTNFDLSDTHVYPNSSLASIKHVEALTRGREIHLSPGNSQPGTPHNNHVLAHELAHIVQQGTGQTRDMANFGRRAQLENEAELTAHRIDTTTPAQTSGVMRTLPEPAQPVVQAFDPRWHRLSVVQGLMGTGFTPEEIGQIYAANWERDFSQVHPTLAAIVLTWKRVKLAASDGKLSNTEIENFNGAVDNLVGMIPFHIKELASGNTYEGYRYYEHMDNPDKPSLSKMVSNGIGGKIPQYILDAREYIKTQLFYALRAYRSSTTPMSPDSVTGKVAASFEKEKQERDQLIGPITVLPSTERAGDKDVAGETAKEVRKTPLTEIIFSDDGPIIGQRDDRARGSNPEGKAESVVMPPEVIQGHVSPAGKWNAGVADGLGRASHALEDFFAHSNFVEIATGEVDPKKTQLSTGTFGDVDKTHAISHKIRALADEIASETPLVDRVLGRTSKNPAPETVDVGSEEPPAETHEDAPRSMKQIAMSGTSLQAIGTVLAPTLVGMGTGALLGGLLGSALGPIGTILGGIGGLVVGGVAGLRAGIKFAAKNVIATDHGVRLLRMVAERLEEDSRQKASPGSHTLLAKDQPGHDTTPFGLLKTIKFKLAQELAQAADRQVIGAMRQVLDAPSPDGADLLLQDVYTTLDKLIAPPGPDHPLFNIISDRLKEVQEAEEKYKKFLK